jgi:hypothetical protein
LGRLAILPSSSGVASPGSVEQFSLTGRTLLRSRPGNPACVISARSLVPPSGTPWNARNTYRLGTAPERSGAPDQSAGARSVRGIHPPQSRAARAASSHSDGSSAGVLRPCAALEREAARQPASIGATGGHSEVPSRGRLRRVDAMIRATRSGARRSLPADPWDPARDRIPPADPAPAT